MIKTSIFQIAIFFLFYLIILSCSTKATKDCMDPKAVKDNPCTMIYQPVCGCDQKTYGNACQAENSGIRSWVPGECS